MISSLVTTCDDEVASILSPSPVVVVVVTFTGKPSFASPTVRDSVRSVHEDGSDVGGGGAGALHVACAGKSAYHASISIFIGVLSPAVAVDCLLMTVLTCRASSPSIVWRSSVSVSVVVSVTTPPCGCPAGAPILPAVPMLI